MAESRKILGLPSSLPVRRSARCETSFGQLAGKGLFGQPDGLVETGRDARLLLLKQLRAELAQIVRRLDRRKIPLDGKQATQTSWIVGRSCRGCPAVLGQRTSDPHNARRACGRSVEFLKHSDMCVSKLRCPPGG